MDKPNESILYKSIESNTSRDKLSESSNSFLKTTQFNSPQKEILLETDDEGETDNYNYEYASNSSQSFNDKSIKNIKDRLSLIYKRMQKTEKQKPVKVVLSNNTKVVKRKEAETGECTRKVGCQCRECQKQLNIIQIPELYEEESTKLCQFCNREIKERMFDFHEQKCRAKRKPSSTSLNIESRRIVRML